MLDQKLFGEKLRNHRKRLGMTQEEVAEKIGVSAQAVFKWEQNICYPDIIFLPGLARLLECTTDDFFEEPCTVKSTNG